MSLAADSIFISAIQSNETLMEKLGYVATTDNDTGTPARLYGTAIGMPEEDAEKNVPVPYAIVTFDGLTNDQGTKDDRYESEYDKVEVSIQLTAKTLDDLHELTQMVRKTVLTYLRANTTDIEDYVFRAEGIIYDEKKPCYWQILTYQCDTINKDDDEQE